MSQPTSETIECPYCAEPINPRAKKCKHCGEMLDQMMRENALLRDRQQTPAAAPVFMNAGGASASSMLRPFPHLLHIVLTVISMGLWVPIYLLMYIFRSKRYYF